MLELLKLRQRPTIERKGQFDACFFRVAVYHRRSRLVWHWEVAVGEGLRV